MHICVYFCEESGGGRISVSARVIDALLHSLGFIFLFFFHSLFGKKETGCILMMARVTDVRKV
jgi:hypothetical protein